MLETCKRCGAPMAGSRVRRALPALDPADGPAGVALRAGALRAPASGSRATRRRPGGPRQAQRARRGLRRDARRRRDRGRGGGSRHGVRRAGPVPSTMTTACPFGSTTICSRDGSRGSRRARRQPPTGPIRAAAGRRSRRSARAGLRSPPGSRREAGGEPIIDRDDEVPERFWAPEVAGLGSARALALLVDQLAVCWPCSGSFSSARSRRCVSTASTRTAPGRRRLAGVGPALRAARRGAQSLLFQSSFTGPRAARRARRWSASKSAPATAAP